MDSMTARFDIYETVLVDGGKIEYYINDVNALFVFHNVKQVKGKGVADADKLTYLNEYHKLILNEMMIAFALNVEKMTGEAIRAVVKGKIERDITKFKVFKEDNWLRPISELFRRGLLIKDDDNPPHYSIDYPKVKNALFTGKFQ